MLQELVAAGRRSRSADAAFVRSHYLDHPDRLHCFVALDERGRIIGFQSLKMAGDDNPYGTPKGWGIIGTHVRPSAARTGIGARLFEATHRGAVEARLPAIEAYIGATNDAALHYYDALGFATCRLADQAICKSLQIARSAAA